MKISHEQLANMLVEIEKYDAKHKYKKLKEICFNYQLSATPSIEEVDQIINVFQQTIKTVGFPGKLSTKLSALLLKRAELLGIDIKSVKTTFKKNFKLCLETATVSIGDTHFKTQDWDNEKMNTAIIHGERVFFSTGSDGIFHLQVRVVDVNEPILTMAEYKKVSSATDTYRIQLPSGKLSVSDLFGEEIIFDLTPGNYKMCVFLINVKPPYQFTFCICLAPTKEEIANTLSINSIPTLEP